MPMSTSKMCGHQERHGRNHDGNQLKRLTGRCNRNRGARRPRYSRHQKRMDGNVANADGSTHKDLA